MERSDHRSGRLSSDSRLPASRRRKYLALLLLKRSGVSVADLTVWFGMSESRVYQILQRAERFAQAVRNAE